MPLSKGCKDFVGSEIGIWKFERSRYAEGMTIQEAIQSLANNGTAPNQEQAYQVLSSIMRGETTDAQIAAYLVALRFVGETPEVIAGSARAMREAATRVETRRSNLVDTCGTGGDGAHTFNISTASALVAAGAGVPVAKHGNRSVSSKSGSADVLAAFGVDITVAPSVMSTCLDEVGIAFLFAPSLHPAMKHAIGPRKEMGIRSLFNILGPLTNPAGAMRGVLGVYQPELVETLGKALASMGVDHYFVVHGSDGLDEITTTGPSTICEVKGGEVEVREISPGDFGLDVAKPGDFAGGEPEENAAIIRAILDGEKGARRDIVLINAAAAMTAGGCVGSIEEALPLAAESIDSGAARSTLERLADRTRQG